MSTLVSDMEALWDPLYLLIVVYVFAVALLTWFGPYSRQRVDSGEFKANKSFWTPIMAAYNLGMTLFSLLCFVSICKVVLMDRPHGRGGAVADAPWIKGTDCLAYARNALFTNIVYAFYLSKYVEFADTVFLIVTGKAVSYLHWCHHIGAALNMGFLYHSRMEAALIFVGLNGFIHTLMYCYYGTSLLGLRLKGKEWLTSLQIAQFLTGFAIFWGYKQIPCFRDSKTLMFTFWYTYAYVGLVLILFGNFYLQTYVLKKKSKAKAK
jgi:hypothetical protein